MIAFCADFSVKEDVPPDCLLHRQVRWFYCQLTVPRLQPPFWKYPLSGREMLVGDRISSGVLFSKQPTPSSCCYTNLGDTLFSSLDKGPLVAPSKHTRFAGASAWRLANAYIHTSGNASVFWQLKVCGRRIVPLGHCRAAFGIWHCPHAVPRMKGDAALLRPGRVTVSREGLSAVLIPSTESAALSLTTWQTCWNILPLAE